MFVVNYGVKIQQFRDFLAITNYQTNYRSEQNLGDNLPLIGSLQHSLIYYHDVASALKHQWLQPAKKEGFVQAAGLAEWLKVQHY